MRSVDADFPPRIALVGLMGSGKTVTGRRLARVLGYQFVDMDREISHTAGLTISAIFKSRGEEFFRREEAALLKKLSRKRGVVVSTGGGAVLTRVNMRLLQKSFSTIWLHVPAVEAWRRVGKSRTRPLLHGSGAQVRLSYMRSMARDRAPFYAAAGARVRAAGKSPDELARVILRRLAVHEVMNR